MLIWSKKNVEGNRESIAQQRHVLLQKQGYEPATKQRTSVNNVTAREKYRVLISERDSFSACFAYVDRTRYIRLAIVLDNTIIVYRR